jgi:hypothetical protein
MRFIPRIISANKVLYLHDICVFSLKVQKTTGTDTERGTLLLVDVDFITLLNTNACSIAEGTTTILQDGGWCIRKP